MRFGKTRWVLLIGLLAMAAPLFSQEPPPARPKVNLGSFVKEIMILKMEGNQSQLAMWFPFEFFAQANLAEGGKSLADAEREVRFLKPFHVIAVQVALDQDDGSKVYSGEKAVRGRASLRLEQGGELKPLDRVPPLVSASVEAMKKMISAEGDAGSANIHVLIFPATTTDRKPVIDTAKKGKLTLVLKSQGPFKETTFAWRTPFDATTPVAPCSRCKEAVSPKWTYCPWCGMNLEKK